MIDGLFGEIVIGLIAIVFLVLGAEWLVNRCIAVAKYMGISPAFIGLTVISIGTSIPEIITHIVASFKIVTGRIDPYVASSTVLGTNIGSDIVQQNLVLGVVALIGTVVATKSFLKKDYYVMIGAGLLLWFFSFGGFISQSEGAIMVVLYLGYLVFLWKDEQKQHEGVVSHHEGDKRNLFLDFVMIVLFLTIIVFSAEKILDVSQSIVTHFNIGASLIGIVILGISTALPEFTTAIVGVLKRSTALSVGTLVGSNITNPLFALGLGAMISGYHVPWVITWFDLPVKLVTALVLLLFLWQGSRKAGLGVSKIEALAMIVLYIAYIAFRTTFFSVDVF